MAAKTFQFGNVARLIDTFTGRSQCNDIFTRKLNNCKILGLCLYLYEQDL